VDVWIALSSIVKGNGLSIFPGVFGRLLPCDTKGVIKRDQYFGKPLNFRMEAGDILVFAGEHLHSSEINSTNLTRHVVSFRITFEKPIFRGESPHAYNYGLVFPSSTAVADVLERSYLFARKAIRTVMVPFGLVNRSRFIIAESELGRFDDLSVKPPQSDGLPDILDDEGATAISVASSLDIEPGTVKAVSKKLCAARSDDGRVFVLSRFCPHEGADLGLGYVEGSILYCPWHNLPIDLETGASPCGSIRPANIVRRWTEEPAAMSVKSDQRF
jgi:nitrite reductase/ring-hydroxylating ferredoxin subunit